MTILSLRTSDNRIAHVRVKHSVICTTPPPSKPATVTEADIVAMLKRADHDTDYPMLAKRRAEYIQKIADEQKSSDGLWRVPSQKEQLDDAGFGSAGPM